MRPLTARILDELPGPRIAWISAWALVPWLNAGANLLMDEEARSAVWDQSDLVIVLNYAALSVAVVITLWGSERLARRLDALRPTIEEVFAKTRREPFRELNRTAVPLIAAGATAAAFGLTALVDDGWLAAGVRGTTWFLLAIPFWTFLWTYAVLQLGLARLGGAQLLPGVARVDPALGLGPLGDVAFIGLWMLLAWLVPVVLTGLPDVVGVAIGMLVLAAGLGAFFVSLVRLHRQMVEVKAGEVELARELYAQAYEPVRSAPSLETLERQRTLLSAASALEKRALAIHEWPIDEGTVARVVTITTSVMAITAARLILDPLGL